MALKLQVKIKRPEFTLEASNRCIGRFWPADQNRHRTDG